ncbi:MAG TPA: hypothetical protein VGL77_15890 [Armatimonadota bacterium]
MTTPEYPLTVRYNEPDETGEETTIIVTDEMHLVTTLEFFDSRTDGTVCDARERPVDLQVEALEITRFYVIEHRDLRQAVARSLQQYRNGEVSRQAFLDEYRDEQQDELIHEVIELVEHDPKQSGCLFVKPWRWRAYDKQLCDIIDALIL